MATASSELLLTRTKAFALRVIRVVESLPQTRTANVIGNQFLRAGTSVGSNYRAARRARSSAEFCSKMGIVEEEADESAYWMELLIDARLIRKELLNALLQEANEIVAMAVASIKTARQKNRRVRKS